MNQEARLQAICEEVCRFRKEDGLSTSYEISDWQATISTDDMEAVVSWLAKESIVEVEYTNNDGAWRAGDVMSIHIAMPMWPAGDLQVAEAIYDNLA